MNHSSTIEEQEHNQFILYEMFYRLKCVFDEKCASWRGLKFYFGQQYTGCCGLSLVFSFEEHVPNMNNNKKKKEALNPNC